MTNSNLLRLVFTLLTIAFFTGCVKKKTDGDIVPAAVIRATLTINQTVVIS